MTCLLILVSLFSFQMLRANEDRFQGLQRMSCVPTLAGQADVWGHVWVVGDGLHWRMDGSMSAFIVLAPSIHLFHPPRYIRCAHYVPCLIPGIRKKQDESKQSPQLAF